MSSTFYQMVAATSISVALLSAGAAVGGNSYSLRSIDSAQLDKIVRQQDQSGYRNQPQYRSYGQRRTASAAEGSGNQVRTRSQNQVRTQTRLRDGRYSSGSASRSADGRAAGTGGSGRSNMGGAGRGRSGGGGR